MKKKIPNLISTFRILLASVMFLFTTVSNGFLSLYLLCGISDFVDGKLARQFNATSLLGARLDTAGDVLYYLALVKILLIQSLIPPWVLIWFSATVVGFLVSAIISKVKFGKFYFIHSFFGRVLGASIFMLPFLIRLIDGAVSMAIVCGVSSIASIESIVIQVKNKALKYD